MQQTGTAVTDAMFDTFMNLWDTDGRDAAVLFMMGHSRREIMVYMAVLMYRMNRLDQALLLRRLCHPEPGDWWPKVDD